MKIFFYYVYLLALCATCHVELVGAPALPEPSDDELYMLESLPNMRDGSRLSCLLKITPDLDGTVLQLMANH